MNWRESLDSPGNILSAAKALIEGDRAEQHGDFIETHECIAMIASMVLRDKLSKALSASDVLLFMACLKLGRITHGKLNKDDAIDLCGYVALAMTALEREAFHDNNSV